MNRATEGMISVFELKALCEKLIDLGHGDNFVVMSRDSEGNGFSPFSGYGLGYYVPETTWSGDFGSAEYVDGEREVLMAEVEATGASFEDLRFDADYGSFMMDDAIDAVVLWPVN